MPNEEENWDSLKVFLDKERGNSVNQSPPLSLVNLSSKNKSVIKEEEEAQRKSLDTLPSFSGEKRDENKEICLTICVQ